MALQWGAVEQQPGRYDFSGYRQVLEVVKGLGLKLQAVMSFHACGGNVGDSAQVPLPKWVMKVCPPARARHPPNRSECCLQTRGCWASFAPAPAALPALAFEALRHAMQRRPVSPPGSLSMHHNVLDG